MVIVLLFILCKSKECLGVLKDGGQGSVTQKESIATLEEPTKATETLPITEDSILRSVKIGYA